MQHRNGFLSRHCAAGAKGISGSSMGPKAARAKASGKGKSARARAKRKELRAVKLEQLGEQGQAHLKFPFSGSFCSFCSFPLASPLAPNGLDRREMCWMKRERARTRPSGPAREMDASEIKEIDMGHPRIRKGPTRGGGCCDLHKINRALQKGQKTEGTRGTTRALIPRRGFVTFLRLLT